MLPDISLMICLAALLLNTGDKAIDLSTFILLFIGECDEYDFTCVGKLGLETDVSRISALLFT